MKSHSEHSKVPASARAGTTLAEVLISLLVMSIGVIALATLFPISVLRSVQATQLTNATNLRYNVEALMNALPQIYSIGSAWQPATPYALQAVVTPSAYASLKYPPLVAICTTAGKSGILEPNWLAPAPITDGAAQWTTIVLHNYIVDPQGEYIQRIGNPNELQRANGTLDFFGNVPNTGYTFTSTTLAFPGVNFTGTTSYDDYQAANLATLPDSWVLQAESKAVSYTSGNTSCTLNDIVSDLSLSTLTASTAAGTATSAPAAYAPSRIVLFDVTGSYSMTRPIFTITGAPPVQTFDWTPPAAAAPFPTALSSGPLPAGFFPVRARVESSERRYTWMLSVRRGFSGSASMDVVVFFRRQFSPLDEIVYPATFQTGPLDPNNSVPANNSWSYLPADPGYDAAPGIQGIDDDGINGVDDIGELGYPGSDDVTRNWVVIQYNASGKKPFYKRGGFVCDANNMRWYRITDIVEGASPTAVMQSAGIPISATNVTTYVPDTAITGFNSVLLRLERPIDQSGSVPTNGITPMGTPPTGGTPTGGAIMMRGIVEVYPIRTQLSLDN